MLSEWHVTPDYIVSHWTDELFALMCEKLIERKQKELDAVKGRKAVSVESLAMLSHGMIEVKRGN